MSNDKENRYYDIINLPHHVSSKHPRMSVYERAAQFSPFAALTGYGEAVEETARLTDEASVLDDDYKAELDLKLRLIDEAEAPRVSITYFEPDSKKSGGSYVTITGTVKRIDKYSGTVILTDKTSVPIERITSIDGEMFKAWSVF